MRAGLDRCLADMPAESQSLLLRYYEGEPTRRSSIVVSLRRLGLSESALRSRVQRLRDRLERCMERYVSPDGATR